jgi:hypothetical protein
MNVVESRSSGAEGLHDRISRPGGPACLGPAACDVAGEGGIMAEEAVDQPVLDLLLTMTADSLEASELDAREVMLARIAALVAVDAPPASYLLNIGAADEVGLGLEDVQGVLLAVAPIVGTARVTAASGNILRALGFAIEAMAADLEDGGTGV